MITQQTTFVLGAGASMAYGFPSGKTLKALIWNKLGSVLPDCFFKAMDIDIQRINYGHGLNIDTTQMVYNAVGKQSPKDAIESNIKDFRNKLKLSPDETIDYFLEHVNNHGDYDYRKLGRLAIAYVLLEYEQEQHLFDDWLNYHSIEKEHQQEEFRRNHKIRPDDRHWYEFLFNQMSRDCSIDEFPRNNVSVITFNYDRSFEYYFLQALMAKYKVDEKKAASTLSHIDIVHVYGQLGELPQLVPDNDSERKRKAVPYGALSKEDQRESGLKNAANGIYLIWDKTGESANVIAAQKLIYRSHNRVVFLGFGYDPTNMKRIMHEPQIKFEDNIKVSGTIKGLSNQRLEHLRNSYHVVEKGGYRSSLFDIERVYVQPKCDIYEYLSTNIF